MPRFFARPLIAVLSAWPALLAAWGLWYYAVDIPFYDQWHEASLVTHFHDGLLTWRDVWAPYNNHRLFFSRLIWLPLSRLTGWNIVAECWVSWILGCASFWILCHWSGGWRKLTQPLPGGLLSILFVLLCFSMNQLPRWLYGFHLQIPLSIVMALAGWTALLPKVFSKKRFGVAALFGCVAAFSFSAGLAFWPCALILLCTQTFEKPRDRLYAITLWIALTIFVFALHAWIPGEGFAWSSHTLKNGAVLLSAVCFYIGNTFLLQPFPALIVGIVGLGYFLTETAWLIGDRNTSRSQWAFLTLGWFVIATALLTAWGRGDAGFDNFSAVRYAPIRNLFWVSNWTLLVLCSGGRKKQAIVTALLLACLTLLALDEASSWSYYKQYCGDFRQARQRLQASQRDEAALNLIYPGNPPMLAGAIENLKKHHLSLFRKP